MKKAISFILAIVLFIAAVPLTSFADDSYTKVKNFRITVDGDVYTAEAYLDKGNNVFLSPSIVKELLGITPPVTEKIGTKYYASLEKACSLSGADSYEFDEVMTAAYIWTELYESFSDENRIAYYDLGTASDEAITYKEMFQLLDKAIKIADKSKLKNWQKTLTAARKSNDKMTRCEGMMALLYAGVALGSEYTEYNDSWWVTDRLIGDKIWDEMDAIGEEFDAFRLIPNEEEYSHGGFDGLKWDTFSIAYRYSFSRKSLLNNKSLLDYDKEQNTMHPADKLSVGEALCAISRLLDSAEKDGGMIKLTESAARNYNKTYITDELIAHAKESTLKSTGDWRGMVIFTDNSARTIDKSLILEGLKNLSEWGFNSARMMLTYQTLFDKNVTEVNEGELQKLDEIIAAAMRYNIHLNLTTFTLPGRWSTTDMTTYTSVGEFDLPLNPERQKEANRIWELLAERYKDIPSSALSYLPMWESTNGSLSTGLPYQPYTANDVAKVFENLMKSIRKFDKEKLILCEPTSNNSVDSIVSEAPPTKELIDKQFDNAGITTNFCCGLYIYAGMTATDGQNIDDANFSMYDTPYPTISYVVNNNLDYQNPLKLVGDLYKCTKINIFLTEVWGDSTLTVSADGKQIYSEALKDARYSVGPLLSRYYPYAESDKAISFILPSDAKTIEINYDFIGGGIEWSGMTVTLPKENEVERWWYPTEYDKFLNGGNGTTEPTLIKTSNIIVSPNNSERGETITISDDITYSTSRIAEKTDKETIFDWGKAVSELLPSSLVRCENAAFSGTTIQSALLYYEDFLKMCDKYDFGWFMNEYGGMFMFTVYDRYSPYGNAKYTPYRSNFLLPEMLKLFQKYCDAPTKVTAKSFTPKLEMPTLSASASKNTATLKWNAVPLADSYRIYMATSKNGKYAYIKNTDALSFIKKKLTSGKTYYFKIRACASLGGKTRFSDYSEVIAVKA